MTVMGKGLQCGSSSAAFASAAGTCLGRRCMLQHFILTLPGFFIQNTGFCQQGIAFGYNGTKSALKFYSILVAGHSSMKLVGGKFLISMYIVKQVWCWEGAAGTREHVL
ncbi:hypothetical protein N7507_010537 [Penicillium longicatenatum]|nr:hypothetical protein N7507_010537 [Penicillium longicatenatum]